MSKHTTKKAQKKLNDLIKQRDELISKKKRNKDAIEPPNQSISDKYNSEESLKCIKITYGFANEHIQIKIDQLDKEIQSQEEHIQSLSNNMDPHPNLYP